jgi:CRISPR-associated endonuclease/helicase Cas3
MQDVAHVRTEPNGQVQWHSLAEHLESVATSAAAYADCFGSSDWAYYIGLLHDLGKFHPDWQAYLRSQPSHDPNERKPKGPRHSGVGAIAALERFQQCAPARPVAYCIAGHHAGLADWYGDLDHRLTIEERERAYYECVRTLPHVEQFLTCTAPTSQPPPWKDAPEQLHLWVRMLFSCLVDADILDTERFMQPDVAAERGRYPISRSSCWSLRPGL